MFVLAAVSPATALAGQQLHGHVPAAVAALRPLDRPPVSQHLHLAIGLPARDPAGLKSLIDDLYDPASPKFRHYLTPAQFTARFGPTEHDYQAVVDFAAANGLKVTATHPNRLVLDVDGAIPEIEKAFHVTLRTYPHPREGRTFYAPDAEPSLDLAVPVVSVSGLDNYTIPHPNHQIKPLSTTVGATPNAGSAPGGAYAGGDFRAAYVPGTALTGAGQSVGLLQFDGYYASDIAAYKTQFGLPDVPLVNVAVNGGITTPGTGNGEVCLDIEMVLSMSPGVSTIYVYEAPNFTSNWVSILSKMANDNLAKQLSCSWGGGSPNSTAETIFQQMATQGQSFFNATGDSDAFTGSVPFPSDSPNITEVGATTLTTTGAGGSFVSETVWNWGLVNGAYVGSSGGSSTYYAIPSWQAGTSMATNQGSTTKRNLPDVALTGDNVYVRYNNGGSGNFGGTSCAAPLWAGFAALMNQQAAATGHATVGFINPAVYTIGNGADYTSDFRDTTTGNNFWPSSPSKFAGVAGYDLCTGWGTPAGTALINALAGAPEVLQVSVPMFAASGRVGGPFTPVSVSCTLTNVGTAPVNWTAGKGQSWTTLSAAAGTLAAGNNTTVTWSINNGANALAAGTYADTVTFTNTTSGVGKNSGMSLAVIGTPANLVASPGNNAVNLTWSAASGATGYNVKRSPASGGPYTTLGSSGVTSYTDATVTNGVTYYYVVSATNGSGQGANSGDVSVIPAPVPSTTSLASSPVTAGAYGTAVTLSATVTGAFATGGVTFKDGSTVLGTGALNGSGVASLVTSALALGNHSLGASYAGDSQFGPSDSSPLDYTVNPRPVTISGVIAAGKVYDGTTTAILAGGAVAGTVGSETVTVVPGSGSFASPNAGTQAVVAVGYALGGSYKDNYVLKAQPGVPGAIIAPRPVVLAGTRVYNATTAAGALVVSNNVDGANLTVTGGLNLVSKDVGSQLLVAAVPTPAVRVQSATGNTGTNAATTISVTLTNTPVAGNTLVAVIATRGNTASRVSGITQTGATWTRAAQATNTSGTTTEIWYAPNVSGAAKAITINQASLRSAAVVVEYRGVLTASALDQAASATGSSTAPLTGTTAVTLQANELWLGGIGFSSSTPTLGAILNSFTSVASAQSTRSTASSNAKVHALERLANPAATAASGGTLSASAVWAGAMVTFRTVTPSTLALAGSAAGNYTLTGSSGAVTITAKALVATGVVANNRLYDGTATAYLTGVAALPTAEAAGAGTGTDGIPYLGDTVTVGGTAAAVFADKHAADGKPVTVTGYSLAGAQAGNYSLTQPAGLSASIAALPITVTAVSATKTYDGTTTAAGIPTLNPPLASGDATSALAQEFQDSSAATNKAIVPFVTINDGNGGANYLVTRVNDNTGTIGPAGATIVLAGLTQTYTGTQRSVTATITPAGLPVNVTYNGSATAPTGAGSYAVVATVSDPDYQGAASGTLVIRPATDLATWRNEYFSVAEQSAGLAADDADPDGDGRTNLAEYALGTDPRTFSPPLVPVRDANGLSITFTRPANLLDVTYGAESSDDLTLWSPVPLEVLESGSPETVRARDPLTTGDPSRRMLRLRFESP